MRHPIVTIISSSRKQSSIFFYRWKVCYVRYMLSPVRLSVCLSSVTFVHPTQAIELFGNVLRHVIRGPYVDIQVKFYGDCPRGTPPSGKLNTRGVAEYSDFGPIECYISVTVQDRS